MNTVTIDTNVLPAQDLIELAAERGFDVAVVSVTEREVGSRNIRLQVNGLGKLLELGIVDESEMDNFVVGSTDDYLEYILQIISSGSFPKSGFRGQLTDSQHRQLRDAMILEAHAREKRDIFVTNDKKGFINNGRRDELQTVLKTRILTREEFLREFGHTGH